MNKFRLKCSEAVLLIVDVQERLAAVMKERSSVTENLAHLIEISRLQGIPILVTEQYPKGLGPTVGEVAASLQSHRAVEKIAFDCCLEPSFIEALTATGRRTVILTGMEAHVCVLQTCIGLLETGHSVHVVRDAVCSRTKSNYKTGIEFMRDSGAVITGTETVLFQLLERAGSAEFKSISQRIK